VNVAVTHESGGTVETIRGGFLSASFGLLDVVLGFDRRSNRYAEDEKKEGIKAAMNASKTTLIIDRDDTLRRRLSRVLEGEGYRVAGAATGQEALALVRSKFFNVVLLGLGLRDPSDLDLLKAVREGHQDSVVISMAAPDRVAAAVECLKAGASCYVAKPVNADQLLATIQVALEKQCLVAENRRLYEEAQRELAERRVVEEALRESQERFKTILHAVIDGIVLTDPETLRFCSVNDAFCRMTGYSQEEMRDMSLADIHAKEDLPEIRETFHRQLRQECSLVKAVRVSTKAGRVLYVDINSAPVTLGGKTYLMGIFRDVTEWRYVEEAWRRSQKMEAVGTLAGGIAHDFNNILYGVLGYTKLVMEDVPRDSRAYTNLEQVVRAGNRAADLIRRILAFSQQVEQEPVRMKLQPVVEETLRLLRGTLPSTVEIHRTIDAACGSILADPGQIQQVLMGLCTNAAQAMLMNGGVLKVGVQEVEVDKESAAQHAGLKSGRYARLAVSDAGVGMDRETLERIFEPYFTTKTAGDGTGLGLATVHGIVENCGGTIAVQSEPGEGATFSVFFPIFSGEDCTTDDEGLIESPASGRGRILFVDDEEMIVKLAQTALRRLGYDVISFTSSAQALEAFQAEPHRFDVVVTDQTMPQMTGAALAGKLLAIRPDVPIVLCTGFSETIDEEQAKAIGIREYVLKPINMTDLGRMIRALLGAEATVEE
jgi:PAS domain S-box-containing protein